MPVTKSNDSFDEPLYQRLQYGKGGIGRWYWDFRDNAIFQGIPKTAQTILDAGCGEGITLEKLIPLFPKAVIRGVDFLDENISICWRHRLPASKGDLTHLEMADSSFDCCILSEVIEHIENYQCVLSELSRILKPLGRLIVVFPNDFIFKIARLVTFKFSEASYDPGHVKQWSPRSMKQALENAGFTVLQSKNIPLIFWPLCLHGIVIAEKNNTLLGTTL